MTFQTLFGRRSPEEEEDRARLLITRRRFLFLGAAAAGAALAQKIIPAPAQTSYSSYFVGEKALYTIQPTPPADLLKTYYDKRFLESLKAATPFAKILKTEPIQDKLKATGYRVDIGAVQELEREIFFYA